MAPTEIASKASDPLATFAAPVVQIRPYRPEDKKEVDALFAAGMLFCGGDHPEFLYLWENYIEECLDDDLANIENVYVKPGGNFWVATIDDEQQDGGRREKVIGMVGLEAKPNQEGELRRMSVDSAYRRYGVGRMLVTHLETWAKANGFVKVWLTTGDIMKQACRFHESLDYEHTKTIVVSEDPRFHAFYFTKSL
uniref:N-acetyltransferase domain-containing protein n=1 Tax=Globisporangium ultimum (strain ATCC 200006 / CBS 805.95 / DAOM BR144) TaxID=431595 RepID=K3XAQ0_GLOUD